MLSCVHRPPFSHFALHCVTTPPPPSPYNAQPTVIGPAAMSLPPDGQETEWLQQRLGPVIQAAVDNAVQGAMGTIVAAGAEAIRDVKADRDAYVRRAQAGFAATLTATAAVPTVTLCPSKLGAILGGGGGRDGVLRTVWAAMDPKGYESCRSSWLGGGQCPGATQCTQRVGAKQSDPYAGIRTMDDVAAFAAEAASVDGAMTKLYTNLGTRDEQVTADLAAARFGVPLSGRNVGGVWGPMWRGPVLDRVPNRWAQLDQGGTETLPPPLPGPFLLVGEADGFVEITGDGGNSAREVVEFKLRFPADGVLGPGSASDRWQLQAYMHMFDTRSGYLVQRVFGTDTLSIIRMERDDAVWEAEVLPALTAFVVDVRRVIRGVNSGDAALRHAALASENPRSAPLAAAGGGGAGGRGMLPPSCTLPGQGCGGGGGGGRDRSPSRSPPHDHGNGAAGGARGEHAGSAGSAGTARAAGSTQPGSSSSGGQTGVGGAGGVGGKPGLSAALAAILAASALPHTPQRNTVFKSRSVSAGPQVAKKRPVPQINTVPFALPPAVSVSAPVRDAQTGDDGSDDNDAIDSNDSNDSSDDDATDADYIPPSGRVCDQDAHVVDDETDHDDDYAKLPARKRARGSSTAHEAATVTATATVRPRSSRSTPSVYSSRSLGLKHQHHQDGRRARRKVVDPIPNQKPPRKGNDAVHKPTRKAAMAQPPAVVPPVAAVAAVVLEPGVKRGRGRPKGSKDKRPRAPRRRGGVLG